MARLSDQLRYFINKKISEDSTSRWCCQCTSSMERASTRLWNAFVNRARSLVTTQPHRLTLPIRRPRSLAWFRGRKEIRGTSSALPTYGLPYRFSLESVNFYLLYLSLMTQYLQPMLPFDHNLKRVIHDVIPLAVFVGNDFFSRSPYP